MVWSKLDDTLHSSQQAHVAGLEALGLWVMCESYCGNQLTNGFVPAWYVIEKCGGKRKGIALADRLVAAGLWERSEFDAEKGWNSVGYLERNPSKEAIEISRAANTKRVAEWRQRQADEGARNAVTNSVTNSVGNGTPARPDPTRPEVVGLVSPGVVGNVSTDRARKTEPATEPAKFGEREALQRKADQIVRDGYDQ